MSAFKRFSAMMVGHALADYPLQGDFLSRAKNRANPICGVPWYQALGAHALIHGGIVWAVTGKWWLGAAEVAVHAATDDAKCRGKISFNTDQAIHASCKLLWAALSAREAKSPYHVREVTYPWGEMAETILADMVRAAKRPPDPA